MGFLPLRPRSSSAGLNMADVVYATLSTTVCFLNQFLKYSSWSRPIQRLARPMPNFSPHALGLHRCISESWEVRGPYNGTAVRWFWCLHLSMTWSSSLSLLLFSNLSAHFSLAARPVLFQVFGREINVLTKQSRMIRRWWPMLFGSVHFNCMLPPWNLLMNKK